MPNLGFWELLLVLAIVVLVFGASRLPQLGESLGKAIRGLKRGLNTDDEIEVNRGDAAVGPKAAPSQVTAGARTEQLPPTTATVDRANVVDAEVVEKKS